MAKVSTPVTGSRAAAWAARARRLVVNLSLSAVTIILMLIVLEGAIRWWGRSGPVLAVHDPVLGKRYVRNFTGRVYVAEAGREIELRFNREGFRGPDRPYEKPLGVKVTVNEFVAYGILAEHIKAADLDPRSLTIATFAICGFANFSSIGIQIGGISALVPSRRPDLAKVGIRAMFGGALASWMTATIAGILL